MALYRKYRPKTFAEFIGQNHIVQTLQNAIKEGTFSHAYLFYGPKGTGKTTIARLFAKAINCENREGYEPCNQCLSCQEINEGRAIDLIEIDAASNRGIEEVRQLKENAKFPPTRLKYKVFIIDEAHQLSKDAANALLKILEEPPKHVVFILATTEIHKMIPTIISRCQRFDFHKLSIEEILKKLEAISKQEGLKIDKSALNLIATNAQGSIRDAESLLDQVISFTKNLGKEKIEEEDIRELLGLTNPDIVLKFIDLLNTKKIKEVIEHLNAQIQNGADPLLLGKMLIDYLRAILLFKIDPHLASPFLSDLTEETKKHLQKYSQQFDEIKVRKWLKVLLEAYNKMKYSPIPQLPLELACLEICENL